MYKRYLESEIIHKTGKGKAIILVGPRQAGKTTLLKKILQSFDHVFLDGDDPAVRRLLNEPNTEQIRQIIGKHSRVYIDEAQRIEGIGLTMKIITDQFPEVQLFASGSSSFDLSNKLNEPLTGRKWEYKLYPVSWEEFEEHHGYLTAEKQLESRLLYGFYPDVLNHPGEEVSVLKNLVNSYLYRDILAYADIRKSDVLDKLVQAVALQIGNEVNYNELSQIVNVDRNTIVKYVEILQKGYVIFKLDSFSRNLRNEIRTNKKIYFYDNGIRNMVLGNFTPIDLRPDKGALWENFLISERVKQIEYKQSLARFYFWRTKQQQEIDYVEDKGGEISGYEFKWSAKKKSRLSRSFLDAYNASGHIIDRKNFRDFVVLSDRP